MLIFFWNACPDISNFFLLGRFIWIPRERVKGSGAETRWRSCWLSSMQGDNWSWSETEPNETVVDIAFPTEGESVCRVTGVGGVATDSRCVTALQWPSLCCEQPPLLTCPPRLGLCSWPPYALAHLCCDLSRQSEGCSALFGPPFFPLAAPRLPP